MIPNKMDVLRKSYTPELKELLAMIGQQLSDVSDVTDEFSAWQHIIQLPRLLTPLENFFIRHELAQAGWGGVFKYRDATSEDLVVYIKH